MSASVEINTNTEKDVLAVPILAVTTTGYKRSLLNEDEAKDLEEDLQEVVFKCMGDTVQMVQVETGIQDDTYISDIWRDFH